MTEADYDNLVFYDRIEDFYNRGQPPDELVEIRTLLLQRMNQYLADVDNARNYGIPGEEIVPEQPRKDDTNSLELLPENIGNRRWAGSGAMAHGYELSDIEYLYVAVDEVVADLSGKPVLRDKEFTIYIDPFAIKLEEKLSNNPPVYYPPDKVAKAFRTYGFDSRAPIRLDAEK